MSHTNGKPVPGAGITDNGWQGIMLLGGMVALLPLAGTLTDIVQPNTT